MAPLVLYIRDASPPSGAVRMLGNILGLVFDLRQIDLLKLEHKSEEFKKINPMGTIPVLIDDGFVVSESNAILKYLLEKYGGEHRERLYPSDPRVRSLIDTCMFFNAGVFFIRLKVVALPTIFEGLTGPSARQLEDIDGAYAILEEYLSRNQCAAADHVTLADLALASTAGPMQAIKKLDAVRFPRCAEWLARLDKEPWFHEPSNTCVTAFTTAMETFWKKNKQQ